MNAARLCRSCGARLRTGNAGIYCSSCARAGRFAVPEGFYDSLELRAAVASYDFGTVFRAVRARTGMSQLHLAGMIGLSQSRISSVERGERRLRDVSLIARIAAVLDIPGPLLGFGAHGSGSVAGEEVSWVDRRDFLNLVTAATLGSNLNPEIERLGSVLPSHAEPVSRRRIGDADIDAIEAITAGFRRSDYTYGGGLCRAAAIAQLAQVRKLEDAICSDEIRTRLRLATADLGWVAAWASWDVDDHDAARRLWTFSLDTARQAEDHPHSTDLAIGVLLDMAYQTLHLDQPKEALRLAQLASVTAKNRKHPAGAILQSFISAHLGWCWAWLGETEASRRAFGQSQQDFAAANGEPVSPWVRHFTDAEIALQQGLALSILSRSNSEVAPAAVDQLQVVLNGGGLTYERTRIAHMPDLSAAYFRSGDIDAAVATGHDAATAIGGLSSRYAISRLRGTDAAAAPFAHKPEVAELREHIRTTLVSAA
jgi:transcriptional regulator with XRE-family HTH domain